MSRNSQAKRAARVKQRARQRAHDRHRQQHDDPAWRAARPEDPPVDSTRVRILTLLDAIGREPSDRILRKLAGFQPGELYRIAGEFLTTCVSQIYGHGWLPTELVRQARLRIDSVAGDLLRWVIAAERAGQGLAEVDPHWRRRFDQVDPPQVGASEEWMARWASARGAAHSDNLELLVRLIDLVIGLPSLDLLLPPPPGIPARRRLVGYLPTDSNPILAKVRALLAKAESTNHEAEAAAFTAKAHELMTRHAIDLATVQQARQQDPGSPAVVRMPVDPPYPDAKALLLQTIATETRCRTLFLKNLQMSTVIGYPSDLEAVELLFTSLLVQAQRALAQAAAGARAGSRQRSVGFRSAFLQGFTGRIGERLAEVNRLSYADQAAGTFLPVLRSQQERIDDFMKSELGGRAIHHRVRGGYDGLGYQHGVMAGDAAKLTAGSLSD